MHQNVFSREKKTRCGLQAGVFIMPLYDILRQIPRLVLLCQIAQAALIAIDDRGDEPD